MTIHGDLSRLDAVPRMIQGIAIVAVRLIGLASMVYGAWMILGIAIAREAAASSGLATKAITSVLRLHAGTGSLCLVGGVLLFVFAKPLGRLLSSGL